MKKQPSSVKEFDVVVPGCHTLVVRVYMFTQFEHQLIKAQIHLKYAHLQPLKNWRLFTSKFRIVQF
jgi:hypothetical protein